MIKIENYMNDGANWQAVSVLAYLRSHVYVEDINEYATLSVGRFENGREQGYVFILRKNSDCLQRNYIVYEHRNSDDICIKSFDMWTLNTPTLEECLKHFRDKWDIDKEFECGHVIEAAQYIEDDIKEYLSIHNL